MIIGNGIFIGSNSGGSAPSEQATDIIFNPIDNTTLTLTWTRGNGEGILVLVKATSAISTHPSGSYTADAAYGSGSQIDGASVVYIGTGTTVDITGLTQGTTYHVRLYEYNGTTYNTDAALNNPQSNISFTTEAQTYLARGTTLGYTLPDRWAKEPLAAFFKSLKDDGNLSELDVAWLLTNRGDKDFASLDMITPASFEITENGTVTYTQFNGLYTENTGFAGNGTTGFLNTGWVPSTNASKFTNNSGSIIFYVNNNVQSSAERFFGAASAANAQRIEILPRTVANEMQIMFNSSAGVSITGVTDPRGLWHLIRTSSTNVDCYKNGVFVTSITQSTTGLPNVAVYALARNAAGVASQFTTNSIGFLAFGSALVDPAEVYAAWTTYKNGVAQYEFTGVGNFNPVVADDGQSNSTGRGEESRLVLTLNSTTGLPYAATNANIKMYYKTVYNATDNGSWVSLDIGANNIEPVNIAAGYQNFGKEPFLGQKLYEHYGRDIYYVKGGQGGTGLAVDAGQPDWNAANLTSDSDCLRLSIVHYLYTGLMKLRVLDPDATFRIFIIWHQGEHDSTETDAPLYAARFADTIEAIRSYGFLANAHISIVRLNFNQNSFEDTVNAAQEAYTVANPSYTSWIEDTATYPRKSDLPLEIRTTYPPTSGDDIHNSYEFHWNVGEAIYEDLVTKDKL